VMFGKKSRSDGTSSIKASQVPTVRRQSQATLGLILSFRMVNSILKINVRVYQSLRRRCVRGRSATAVVGLWRQVRRDRVGGSGQSRTLGVGCRRLGRHGSEGLLTGPEGVVPRLGDVDRSCCPTQSHADAGHGVLGVESHYLNTSIELFLCKRDQMSQNNTK